MWSGYNKSHSNIKKGKKNHDCSKCSCVVNNTDPHQFVMVVSNYIKSATDIIFCYEKSLKCSLITGLML